MTGRGAGVAHLDSRGDGRYLISNCETRRSSCGTFGRWWSPRRSARRAGDPRRRGTGITGMRFPAEGWTSGLDDVSVQTYRGHVVDQTPSRTYLVPETTGQRYLYSGSSDGRVVFWDVVSGERIPSGGEEDDGGGGSRTRARRWGPARTLARVRRRRAREPRANRRRVTAPRRRVRRSSSNSGGARLQLAPGETDARRRGWDGARAMGRGAVTGDARRRRGRAWTGTERYAPSLVGTRRSAPILVFVFPSFPAFRGSRPAAARPAL